MQQRVAPGLAPAKMNRRQMLKAMAASAGCALLPKSLAFASESGDFAAQSWSGTAEDEAFLDDLERQACLFFWEQGSDRTGQILDRARNDLTGGRDPRRMASIASTGFGLTALCIADQRGFLPHAQDRRARAHHARLAPEYDAGGAWVLLPLHRH
jgi:hypothetical protein